MLGKHLLFLLVVIVPFLLQAGPEGELIFSDDFERAESQEEKDEPGKGWGTNSRTRAQGNKQVDLREGAMFIHLSPKADHAVSVTHPAEFTDGAVGLRFRLDDPRDSLGLNFADLEFKEVHAGHLFVAKVSPTQVHLQDLKTGNMDLEIREARQTNSLNESQKEMLKTKESKFSRETSVGEWHDMLVEVAGDTMTLSIDGQKVGSFSSEGIAHPTKRLLRLAVPRNAVVDDVKIWRAK